VDKFQGEQNDCKPPFIINTPENANARCRHHTVADAHVPPGLHARRAPADGCALARAAGAVRAGPAGGV
jgi:hypothetical protein